MQSRLNRNFNCEPEREVDRSKIEPIHAKQEVLEAMQKNGIDLEPIRKCEL